MSAASTVCRSTVAKKGSRATKIARTALIYTLSTSDGPPRSTDDGLIQLGDLGRHVQVTAWRFDSPHPGSSIGFAHDDASIGVAFPKSARCQIDTGADQLFRTKHPQELI